MADHGVPELDDGALAVVAHVLLQHLSVVSGALALLADDAAGRPRPPRAQLLEQAVAANEKAVAILHELLRGRPPSTLLDPAR